MEKKEFLDINKNYFKQLGFLAPTKTKFYYEREDLILCIWLQHSTYSKLYYVNYSICLKTLHPEIQDPVKDFYIDANGRMGYDSVRGFHIEYETWNAEDYLKDLDKLYKRQVVPIIKHGLKYIKKYARNQHKFRTFFLIFPTPGIKELLSLK